MILIFLVRIVLVNDVCFSKYIHLIVPMDSRNSTCWQNIFLKVIKIKVWTIPPLPSDNHWSLGVFTYL